MTGRLVTGSVYVAVMACVAAVAAWPVYRSGSYMLVVAVGVVVAAALVAVVVLRGWGSGVLALLVSGAVVVLGVPLAVPARLAEGPVGVLRGLGDLAAGVVVGWKDLLTVELPVGAYRNLLVPALVVFLCGTAVALRLAWRADHVAYAAVPVALAQTGFGLFFGRTTTSAPLVVGPVVLAAPVETAVGASALVASVLWLAVRSRAERVAALRRAASASGMRMSRASQTDGRRVALGAGMLAVALAVAVAVVPAAASGSDRLVLRSGTGPEIDVSREVSPLSEYRSLFSDARADAVLFTVSGTDLPDRVRIATLDAYDGAVFRSGGVGAVDAGRFVRVPAVLDAGTGDPVSATFRIGDLDGIWMPTAGALEQVAFSGSRAAALEDGFYYNAAASAGVQTAGGGLRSGDAYLVTAVAPAAPALPAAAAPGGDASTVEAPESLRTWVREHVVGTGGGALAGLVSLLRERGFLSHGLAVGETAPVWAQGLTDYVFQPSASGHSLARIDQMFRRLLEREADPRAADTGNYVAAVGDDEQFAVAVALIATELGFPARVVVGARLATDDPTLPVCEDAVCRGDDVAVWTEVRSASGEWLAVDVTPQYAQSPSLEVTRQRDPENVTEVLPDTAREAVPPDPFQDDDQDDAAPDDGGLDLAWLVPILRWAGVGLAVLGLLAGPFAVVAAAKLVRRRARRGAGDPAVRIAGGWDDYVDAAVDAGSPVAPAATRSELATAFATRAGGGLAVAADRAAFGRSAISTAEADEFWRIVDEERRGVVDGLPLWRRVAAVVSLRSFLRALRRGGAIAPRPSARRLHERGRRGPGRGRRTAP